MFKKIHQTKHRLTCLEKTIVLVVCMVIVSGHTGLARQARARDLTFEQALEKMIARNEALKAAQSTVDKSRYDQKAARGLYFPKIWMDAQHTTIDDNIVIDLNDIRTIMAGLHGIPPGMLPSFESAVQTTNFSNAAVNFSWVIYSGGKIQAANRASDARVLENTEQFLYTRSILTTELVKRYYGYTLSIEAARVYKQVLAGIEQHLNRARKLEKNGMLALSERLHAEVAYAEALRHYKKAARQIQIVQAGLKNSLSFEESITPVSPLFLTKKIMPLDQCLSRAHRENHILKKLAATKKRADQGYRAELSAHRPKVYLFGKYELYQDDLTVLEPEWAAGVGVNLSIFEGFSPTHKILAAKKQKDAIRYYAAKAMRDIDTLIEKTHHELMTQIEQYEAIDASMRFARENLRVQQRAFSVGMTTSLYVVDAQLALSKVKIEQLNAVYAFDVALARLLEVCGLSQTYETYQNNSDVEVRF